MSSKIKYNHILLNQVGNIKKNRYISNRDN